LLSSGRGASPEKEDKPIDERGKLYLGVARMVVLVWAMVMATGCIITINIILLHIFGV
jgi:hypothetical protein